MFYAHNINSNNLSVKNLVLLFFTIVLGFASVITLAQISIPSTIENARQTIAKITITESGTDSAPLIEMSSGGIFIDPSILTPETSFSGKVLGIDDNNNIIYVLSQGLVTSGGGGIGGTGDGYWTGVGSDIYNNNSGNVGIGTSTMSGKLHITSSGQTEVYLEEINSGSAANINFKSTSASIRGLGGDSSPDVFYIGIISGSRYFVITPLGFIGMGTDTPKANLQVIGNFIAGNYNNTITGSSSTIAGGGRTGFPNAISGDTSFIGGGYGNAIRGDNSAIVMGGKDPTRIIGDYSFIGGGNGNTISGDYSSIVGGNVNSINGSNYSSVGGGENNNIYTSGETGNYSFIGGGNNNTITGDSNYSVIVGGQNNTIKNASNSFAAGYSSKVYDTNTFLWNSSSSSFTSAKRGTFIINVPLSEDAIGGIGGVGINNNFPQTALDVEGLIRTRPNPDLGGCIAIKYGAIWYRSTDNHFYGCTASGRIQLDN